MLNSREIPSGVLIVVGDVLGEWYYSHDKLNALFAEAGAPGDPPEGNCVNKCQRWFRRCNQMPDVDALDVLGGVLEEFMEQNEGRDLPWKSMRGFDSFEMAATVTKVLAKNGLSYRNGRVFGGGEIPSVKTLEEAIRGRDLEFVEERFRKASERVATEPGDAATDACRLLESLFKCYIDEEGLELPKTQTIGKPWPVVQRNLRLHPSEVEDNDVKRILSGLTSIVDGIGALRTHAGAHGPGPNAYRLEARHARLAVNAAHTAALCVLDTWTARG